MRNMTKELVCHGDKQRIRCKLDNEDFGYLPSSNVKFNLITKNNLTEVDIATDKKKGFYIRVVPDEHSTIECDKEFGKYGLELRCQALGPHTPDFPDIWEQITELDALKEPPDEVKEKLYEIYNHVLNESFPDIKDRIDYIKLFVAPKLSGSAATAVTKGWVYDEQHTIRSVPLWIALNPDELDHITDDPIVQDRVKMDLIHELVHVKRHLENQFTTDRGEEEGETVTEALARGDWVIRINYPFPDGYIEQIVYVKRCILPKQYCFENLKQARDFEEFNYELVTGEQKPKPLNPETTPDWDEIEKRIPVAPIVDMIRGMEGSYNVLRDVNEYWVITQSPSGKKYLYTIADLHIDHKSLGFTEVIEDVDKLDALKGNEDIEKIWDAA